MSEVKNIILIDDVLKMLGISARQTIYTYISEGKLNPINKDDWHIEQRYEFDLNDVLRLKEELKLPGLTTSEVAAKLGVSQTTVNKYIKKGLLKSIKKEYKGRPCNFVTEEALKEFIDEHHTLTKPITKKHFYDRDKNIGLFQPFLLRVNDNNESFARIMDIENDIIALTDHEEKITYDELLKRGYKPVYEIKESKAITKEGYAHFNFKVPATVKAKSFNIIDSFYTQLSPVNMRIDKDENDHNSYLIQVKPALLESPFAGFFDMLDNSIVSGQLKKRSRGIYIDSDIEIIRLRLDRKLKKQLEEMARREEKSIEELLLLQVNKLVVENGGNTYDLHNSSFLLTGD